MRFVRDLPRRFPQRGLQQIAGRIGARLDAFFSLGTLEPPSDTTSADDETLLANVETALASNSYGTKFGDFVEDRFRRSTAAPRGRLFVRAAAAGTLIYNLFLLIDMAVVPDVMWLVVPLQLCLVTPIIVAYIVAISRFGVDAEVPSFVCLSLMLAGTIATFAISRSPHVDMFASIFGLYLVSGSVGLAMGFRSALAFSAICLVAVPAAILLHPSLDAVDRTFSIALLFAAANYSLAGSYRIEAGTRSAYLFALRESLRARLLDASNRRLTTLVAVDGLTGIGNRRHLDEKLDALWRDTGEDRPLAFLLIDIDHFKAFNDTHGHPVGDECLRRVAQALASETQGGAVTLARYGGEEFAVVVAGAAMAEARALAEHLRGTVETLAVVLDTGEALSVTISIGCAVITPSGLAGPADLIAAADAALYQAKREGRNRVEIARLKSTGPAPETAPAAAPIPRGDVRRAE